MQGTFDYPKIRSDAKLGQSRSELGCSGAFVIHFSRYEKELADHAAVQMLEGEANRRAFDSPLENRS